MKIIIEQRDQYGATVYHPLDDTARTFASIAKTKTLTLDALQLIRALGYEIEVKHPTAAF